MLTNPPMNNTQLLNIKAIKAWFENFNTYYPYPNLKTQAENYSYLLKINSLLPHKIEYKYIDCSYFIYLSIFHFNSNAASALCKSIQKVETYLKKEYNIYIHSQYPLAVHFALLAKSTTFWDNSMYDYFELVDLDKLSPGTIVAWIFDSFLNPKNDRFILDYDTGHVGCITSHIEDNSIEICHSVPRKDDPKPKKQGGPCITRLNSKGHILENIKRKQNGGAIRFKK